MVQKVKKEPTLHDEFKKAQLAAIEAVTNAKIYIKPYQRKRPKTGTFGKISG